MLYGRIGFPKIYETGLTLGTVALVSSSEASTCFFDANSSSIYNDPERLLVTSYVSTANTLTETPLYDRNQTYGAPSTVTADNVADIALFVVYDSQITTLSLTFLISVPCITVLLWVIKLLIEYNVEGDDPSSADHVEGMQRHWK
ncbi:hypothetical protein AYL99_10306 [Fonsecaea erecta]|uniref:Uncharacterized protein n=1 Tax=Fonsecaea erecta TaxID=1367422 RepID=A0A178Z835_9EURO|nr:hypothetical protein AYL99_10306 [Fonsecaea erecta]OAP55333.1 hypothetical protein AYL99_10306 [Fonsecaea erecta]